MHGKSTCSSEKQLRWTKALKPITRRLEEIFQKSTWTIRLIRKLCSWDHCLARRPPLPLIELYNRKTCQMARLHPKSTQWILCPHQTNHRPRRSRHNQFQNSKVGSTSWLRWQHASIWISMRNSLRSNYHVTCALRWARQIPQDADLLGTSCKRPSRPDLASIPKSQRGLRLSPQSNHL